MSRFNNINDSLKSTSRKYSLNLKENHENQGNIEIKNINTEKQAKGTFSVIDDTLKIAIIESSYNNNYLKKIIVNDLRNSELTINNIKIKFNIPRVGSSITSRLFIDQPTGSRVNLDAGIYYYAVDSELVDCNGWKLQKTFKAELEKQIQASCDSINLPPLTYTVFKLISEI